MSLLKTVVAASLFLKKMELQQT